MTNRIRIILPLLCILAALLLLSSCTAKGSLDLSYDNSAYTSTGDSSSASRSNAVVSLDRFKKEIEAENLGTVSEINGDYGYDAALAVSEDQTNYIYMYLPDKETARSLLTDSDGDGQQDADLTLVLEKENYELYTQEHTASDSSDSSLYGKCLRAGCMLIIISGPLENKESISSHADNFITRLGFDLT